MVDAKKVIKTFEKSPLGINFDFLRDDDANRPLGSRTMVEAMNEVNPGFIRYPGGEMSDYYFFSQSPWTESDTRVFGWWNTQVKDNLDFDEYMGYLKQTNSKPFLVTGFDLEEKTGISKQAYLEHAVEWVRYANLTQGYGVKYWEIGNENWHKETLSRYVEQNN